MSYYVSDSFNIKTKTQDDEQIFSKIDYLH